MGWVKKQTHNWDIYYVNQNFSVLLILYFLRRQRKPWMREAQEKCVLTQHLATGKWQICYPHRPGLVTSASSPGPLQPATDGSTKRISQDQPTAPQLCTQGSEFWREQAQNPNDPDFTFILVCLPFSPLLLLVGVLTHAKLSLSYRSPPQCTFSCFKLEWPLVHYQFSSQCTQVLHQLLF